MFLSQETFQAFLQANPGLTDLDVFVHDICGNPVGKRVPIDYGANIVTRGVPISRSMQLLDVVGETNDPQGLGLSDGDPDVLARPLEGSLAPVPWSGGSRAQMLCVLTDEETGAPSWHEPRQVLADVLSQFDALGLQPVVAIELEFHLIEQKRDERGAPTLCASPLSGVAERQGHPLSLSKLDEFDSVLSEIMAACAAQSLPATSVLSENAAGQFEINLSHSSDVLQTADHAALLRRAVRATARQIGLDATFMAKPFLEHTGNGMHVHLSLREASGRNIFDPETPDGDLRLGHAIAGLQTTMHEAMAIFAPDINGYRRFRLNEFTPVTRDWGENNRSVAIRLPLYHSGRDRRLEHRLSSANANPYLVLAAVLAGVHHGLVERRDPSAELVGNAGETRDETLPATLWDALRVLSNARILPRYLGTRYAAVYRDVKTGELERFMDRISGREYRWYL